MFVLAAVLRHSMQIALLVGAVSAVAVFGAEAPDHLALPPADPLVIYRQAGVSSDQELAIARLASDYEKSARVRLARIKNLSIQLREQSFQAELDEAKIIALQEEINVLQSGLCLDRLKLMLSIRQLLSAEQKERLVQLMKEKENAPPSHSQ